jgi:hypothetical protein
MLGSFIAHGLTQEEAGSESLLQMLVLLALLLSSVLTPPAWPAQIQQPQQSVPQCYTS